MSSFHYNNKLVELDSAIGTPQYTSKILGGFQQVLVNYSLETAVQISNWELDTSYNLKPLAETAHNNTILNYHMVKSFSKYYGTTRLGLVRAKEIQAVDMGHWSIAGNQMMSEMYKMLDKELYSGGTDGNIGLISGVTPVSAPITNGEQLVDTMIAKARSLNLGLSLDATSPVKVFLGGELAEIYGSGKYNGYKSISEMIPTWIEVIELPTAVNSANRMDIASVNNNIIYRGKLPMIMTNGVETITDSATFSKVQGLQIGYQSASVDKRGNSVVSIIKA